jgi:hypothetical protein
MRRERALVLAKAANMPSYRGPAVTRQVRTTRCRISACSALSLTLWLPCACSKRACSGLSIALLRACA